MKAKIEAQFKAGFLLSNENLLKIEDIIKNRFAQNSDEYLYIYEIYRNDNAVLNFDTIEEICNEENSRHNYIKYLKIKLSDGDNNVEFLFSKNDRSYLTIVSYNRVKHCCWHQI